MDFLQSRKDFISNYLIEAGITDKRLISAFLKIPREKFVPKEYRDMAYLDSALPIGEGQTISQPSLVAVMTLSLNLNKSQKVLEVGTGSGYQAAILSQIAKDVYTVERIPHLARNAEKIFQKLSLKNIHVFVGDGTLGLAAFQPYQAIIVTAATNKIPQPLIDQLAEDGKMIIPVEKGSGTQELKLLIKKENKLEEQDLEEVIFVPLIGKYGK